MEDLYMRVHSATQCKDKHNAPRSASTLETNSTGGTRAVGENSAGGTPPAGQNKKTTGGTRAAG